VRAKEKNVIRSPNKANKTNELTKEFIKKLKDSAATKTISDAIDKSQQKSSLRHKRNNFEFPSEHSATTNYNNQTMVLNPLKQQNKKIYNDEIRDISIGLSIYYSSFLLTALSGTFSSINIFTVT